MLSKSALRLLFLGVALVLANAQEAKKEVEAEPPKDRMLQISSSVEKIAPKLNKLLKEGEEKIAEAIPVAKDKANDMMSKVKSGPGFFSIFFMKKIHKNGEEKPEIKPLIISNQQHPTSLILFKIKPNNGPHMEHHMGQHLLGAGGSDDVDNKFAKFQAREKDRQHLLGGGGDQDVDRIRVTLTGTGEDVNQDPFKHFLMPLPFFNFDKNGMKPFDISDEDNNRKPTLIIRTDDGSNAFISNDFGFDHRAGNNDQVEDDDENEDESMMSSSYRIKKCMMHHLIRLKASLYYRSVLNMLFISSLLLFLLLLTMLIVRTCRRKRMIRECSMDIAAIDSKLAMGVGSPPPRYDELIDETKKADQKKSSMINELVQGYRNQYTQIGNSRSAEGDNVSVSSLPNYDEHAKKMQNFNEKA